MTTSCACGLPFDYDPDTDASRCPHCDDRPLPDHRQVRCPECVRLNATERST
jgi:hypothetical protein